MSLDLADRHVLVTGGAGFIGHHLLQRLSRAQADLTCADIKRLREDAGKVRYCALDITDADSVDQTVRGRDIVIHLASRNFATSLEDPVSDYATGIDGTLNILEAARKNDVDRVIYASSYMVYGPKDEIPVKEDVLCKPLSPYGVSKFAGENYCRLYSDNHGISTICLRFTNVYGPFQESGYLVPNLIARIGSDRGVDVFGDGGQTRDFIYVEDVAEAVLRACNLTESSHSVINVGTGTETSVLELISAIGRELGKRPTVKFHRAREGEMKRFAADISKMKELLHYSPGHGLEEGIRKTIFHVGERGP